MRHSAATVIWARVCFNWVVTNTPLVLAGSGYLLARNVASIVGNWRLFETSRGSPGGTRRNSYDMASRLANEQQMTKVEVKPRQGFVHGHARVFRAPKKPKSGNYEIMWSLNWMGMMLCPARHRHSHPTLQGGIVRSYVHYGWTLGNCKITIESWWKWKDIFSRNADASNSQHFAGKHLKASHLKKPVNLVLLSVLYVVILPCATSFKWKDEDPGDQQSCKVSMFSPFLLVLSVGAFSLISSTSVTRQHRNDSSIGTSWEQVLKTSSTPEIQQISCAPGCQRKISCRVAEKKMADQGNI